jgi:hypothetical protein
MIEGGDCAIAISCCCFGCSVDTDDDFVFDKGGDGDVVEDGDGHDVKEDAVVVDDGHDVKEDDVEVGVVVVDGVVTRTGAGRLSSSCSSTDASTYFVGV